VKLRPIVAALVLVLILAPGLSVLAQQTATTTLSIAVTHAAILTWTPSTSVGVTGYNVYRGTVSGGPYVLLRSVNALTYADTTGTSGSTYFWVITAVQASQESVHSNEVSATIP
jgi:fibronectin type 3 domain-containing protein